MISFIAEHRSALRVEPICRLLPIASSTYYEVIAQRKDVAHLSARARRDIAMKAEVRRAFNESFQVYGARRAWRQLRREGQSRRLLPDNDSLRNQPRRRSWPSQANEGVGA